MDSLELQRWADKQRSVESVTIRRLGMPAVQTVLYPRSEDTGDASPHPALAAFQVYVDSKHD
jgi:hypothetical protein